jgi:hypothetical protein
MRNKNGIGPTPRSGLGRIKIGGEDYGAAGSIEQPKIPQLARIFYIFLQIAENP